MWVSRHNRAGETERDGMGENPARTEGDDRPENQDHRDDRTVPLFHAAILATFNQLCTRSTAPSRMTDFQAFRHTVDD
jgi:hypothetical protein